jgi:predicted Zn-dependent protease
VKKLIAVLCMGLMLAGCQKPPQNGPATNERQEVARKLFAQSMVLLQQKDLKGAVTSLEESIKVDPSDPNPYLVLGQILLKAGEFSHAAEFLDSAAKAFPNNGTIFYMMSIANRMDGKKLPAVLAARHSYEVFNAAGDAPNAQASAMLLQELIKEAQEQEKVSTAGPSKEGAAKK